MKITLYCMFCPEKLEREIETGGFSRYYNGEDVEDCLCPQHQAILPFLKSQCPGCVGGPGDCPLWQSFAYRHLDLSADELHQIQKGICPRRVNGTVSFDAAKGDIEDIDLRDKPDVAGGVAMSKAIQEYSDRYHGKTA